MPLRPRFRSMARAATYRAGFDVARFPRPQTVAGLLHAILQDRRVDAVVDVGANTGQFGRLVRAVGFAGPIVSFEPLAEQAAIVETAARAAPPWAVHHLALGATRGTQELNVAGESMLSSFLSPNAQYEQLLLDDVSTTARTVTIETLDHVSATEPLLRDANRLLLKSDTQGFDLEVLRGSAKTLPRVVALQIELAVRPIYEGAPGWQEVLAEVEELGFTLAGLFPANTDRHLRLVDVDGVFVRDDAVTAGA